MIYTFLLRNSVNPDSRRALDGFYHEAKSYFLGKMNHNWL
uniref:Uncharacterized protein n=1 Tax=Arundo donax TaxID=35708 RepID=A0A0A9GCU1_ARUDO